MSVVSNDNNTMWMTMESSKCCVAQEKSFLRSMNSLGVEVRTHGHGINLQHLMKWFGKRCPRGRRPIGTTISIFLGGILKFHHAAMVTRFYIINMISRIFHWKKNIFVISHQKTDISVTIPIGPRQYKSEFNTTYIFHGLSSLCFHPRYHFIQNLSTGEYTYA